MNGHTRDNGCVCYGCRGFDHVPTSNQSGFASKNFHFDVEYHVAGYLLIADWCRLYVKEDIESNANVLHFLGNGIGPEGIAILLVKFKGFFDGLRHFNAKVMGPFQVLKAAFPHKRNNVIPLPQNMRNPPVEGWFMVNAKDFGIFSRFNRVRLLEVSKGSPRTWSRLSIGSRVASQ
jgi:hypothetical protein